MTKTKSTKRALLMSALALIMCVSMLVGSTFAWFTDSVSSGRNTIQSGNLDVQLFYTTDAAVAADPTSTAWIEVDSQTDVFSYDRWEPGFAKVAYFKVVNNGSLALKYQLATDVYEEAPGINMAGDSFLLSDYIKTAVVNVGATRDEILDLEGTNLKASFGMSKGGLTSGASAVVGMAIWMPTTVGNEANHNGTAPSISFGINLIATQDTVEVDSFGKDYDEGALYPEIDLPAVMTAGLAIDLDSDNIERYEIKLQTPQVNGNDFTKVGSVIVPKDAIADGTENIEVVIKKMPVADSSVPVAQNQKATTIDVTVTGIKEGNTKPVEVTVNVGPDLGTIALYHKSEKIDYISYDNNTGVLRFQTTSFSPFTIVYDGEQPVLTDKNLEADIADVTTTDEIVNLDWEAAWEDGSFLPPIGDQKLDVVYKFVAPHDSTAVKNSYYKDWECDYYVMLKSDTLNVLPADYIALGGHYGEFGWNGFFNPEVEANVEIPLLGSVTKLAWTYEAVASLVSEFKCGVGVNSEVAGDALNGSEFVVMLRLTNPETREYINVATVVYDFATGESVLTTSDVLNPAN